MSQIVWVIKPRAFAGCDFFRGVPIPSRHTGNQLTGTGGDTTQRRKGILVGYLGWGYSNKLKGIPSLHLCAPISLHSCAITCLRLGTLPSHIYRYMHQCDFGTWIAQNTESAANGNISGIVRTTKQSLMPAAWASILIFKFASLCHIRVMSDSCIQWSQPWKLGMKFNNGSLRIVPRLIQGIHQYELVAHVHSMSTLFR